MFDTCTPRLSLKCEMNPRSMSPSPVPWNSTEELIPPFHSCPVSVFSDLKTELLRNKKKFVEDECYLFGGLSRGESQEFCFHNYLSLISFMLLMP